MGRVPGSLIGTGRGRSSPKISQAAKHAILISLSGSAESAANLVDT